MKRVIIIIISMICLSVNAQSLLTDIQMNDSVMRILEIRYGNKQPWRYLLYADSPQSIVIHRPRTSMVINPDVRKITMPITTTPWQSAFSWKDNQMWYKDYTFGTFLSDILIGR